jgi:hypothetical protein
MTPHDLELKLYRDIVNRLEQIEQETNKLYALRSELCFDKDTENSIFLCTIWAMDAKDKLRKYAERHYK